jgi:hypothetical protein
MLYIYTDTQTERERYIYIYTRIYIYYAILIISENYTKANESIAGWLNGILVSIITIYYVYTKYT